jgi:hypothetical protein
MQHQRAVVPEQPVEERQLTLAADEAARRSVGQQITDCGLRLHFPLTSIHVQYCARAAGRKPLRVI